MAKEELVDVVSGFVTDLMEIGILVPLATVTAFILIKIDFELVREQVELIEHEQVVPVVDRVTSLGTVTTMLEPFMRVLTLVKDKLMSATTPI